tara:strand:- start:332 stop:1045 length:714 start_codon:yes stop_codon:yes gene_type:complete
MAKKKKSSKKKTSSRKKTKDSAVGTYVPDQGTEVSISAAGMPAFNLNAPTADEIQAAAKELHGTESLDESVERAKKAVLETHEKLMQQEAPPLPVLQEKILVPTKLEICSCEYGYGVFAIAQIEDGEIIEEAPIIPLQLRTGDIKENNKILMLLPHLYPIFCNCTDCEELGRHLVLSSGYVQMYNHSEDPNARILQHKAKKRIYTIEALKSIDPGEQILLNYGSNYPERWLKTPGSM